MGRPCLTGAQKEKAATRKRENDKQRKQIQRQDANYHTQEQAWNTLTHQKARQDAEYRAQEQAWNTLAYQEVRQDAEYWSQEQARDTAAHQVARDVSNETWEQMITNWKSIICEGPTHNCHSCAGLFFKYSTNTID